MSKIVNLDDVRSHITGEAVCVTCKHRWKAVAPVGKFAELECPKCQTMKGVFDYGVVPETYMECQCGCHIFTVSGVTEELLCWQCGTAQRFE